VAKPRKSRQNVREFPGLQVGKVLLRLAAQQPQQRRRLDLQLAQTPQRACDTRIFLIMILYHYKSIPFHFILTS